MDGQNSDQGGMIEQILDVIAREGMIERARITLESTLEDLHLKSMDIVIILAGMEEHFRVYIPIDAPLAEARDVRGFVDQISAHITKQRS